MLSNSFNCYYFLIHSIFYRAKSLKNTNPHVVLDSNQISGTVIDHEYSPNGEYCAFTIWNVDNLSFIQVIDVETGQSYGRSLKFNRFFKKIVWSGDSKGFFIYVCYVQPFKYSFNFYNVFFSMTQE